MKSFSKAQIIIIISIVIITAVATYGIIKINEVLNENESLRTQAEISKPNTTIENSTTTKNPEPVQAAPQPVITVEKPKTIINQNNIANISQTGLEITNVKTSTMGYSTIITWETNMVSDSRIFIGENFYVSDQKSSKTHSTTFSNLSRSTVYNYEIVATAGSLKSSYFGKFSTPSDYTADFEYSKKDNCFVVIIENGSGVAIPDVPIKISGSYFTSGGSKITPRSFSDTTSIWGEVEYCNPLDEVKVENTQTGKVYYDGELPLYFYR